MMVALSIRLAILQILTQVDFAFFDEPTTNLDIEKRKNLAECIQNIRGFEQIFVISHDDTFQHGSDYVIRFEKDENENVKKLNSEKASEDKKQDKNKIICGKPALSEREYGVQRQITSNDSLASRPLVGSLAQLSVRLAVHQPIARDT